MTAEEEYRNALYNKAKDAIEAYVYSGASDPKQEVGTIRELLKIILALVIKLPLTGFDRAKLLLTRPAALLENLDKAMQELQESFDQES